MKVLHFHNKLSLPAALAVTVGAVIGVGIFVIVGPIGAKCGGTMPLAFGLAALPALFGTLVSVALGGTIPADGGGFFYTRALVGERAAVAASAFITLGALGAMGAVSVGVADYLRVYLPGAPRVGVAAALILLSYGVNRVGILASSWFQVIMVGQLCSALLVIVVAGLASGAAPDLAASPPAGWGLGGFSGGTILASLAYVGFNIIGELGDEVENPRRNIPLAIAGGLGIIVLFYVGAAWITAGNLTPRQMGASPVALLDAAMLFLPGWFAHYITLAALTGAVTSINAVFLAVPREMVALAEAGYLPRRLLRFNQERQTFTTSLAVVLVLGMAVVLTDREVDYFGVITVVGLMLLNALVGAGSFRLMARFPAEVAAAAFPIRRWWLWPCALLTVIFSAGFSLIGVLEEPSVGIITALILCLSQVVASFRRRGAE